MESCYPQNLRSVLMPILFLVLGQQPWVVAGAGETPGMPFSREANWVLSGVSLPSSIFTGRSPSSPPEGAGEWQAPAGPRHGIHSCLLPFKMRSGQIWGQFCNDLHGLDIKIGSWGERQICELRVRFPLVCNDKQLEKIKFTPFIAQNTDWWNPVSRRASFPAHWYIFNW